MSGTTKCTSCGRFISFEDMTNDAARFHHEPDSHFGPEVNEWTCARCVTDEQARAALAKAGAS